MQISVEASNARLVALETELNSGGGPGVLRLLSGAAPANCAAAQTGTVIAEITLPADPFSAPSNRVMGLSGTWSDAQANNAGTIAHYRFYKNGGTACVIQGTVTSVAVGTGEMLVDNPTLTQNQPFNITAFTITDPNG